MPLRSAADLLERLRMGERFCADGAMGTELIRRNVAMSGTTAANLENPLAVLEIHRASLSAGAQILTANTFGVHDGENWPECLKAGIALARQAAAASAADVWTLVPFPARTVLSRHNILKDWKTSGCDFPKALLIETCTNIREACEAVRLAAGFELELLAVTCHFEANGRMPDGTRPIEAAEALRRAGADVVGANCGHEPGNYPDIARAMRSAAVTPLLFQPCAGLPWQTETQEWVYPLSPSDWSDLGQELWLCGVSIVGGCCGVTPDAIHALCGDRPVRGVSLPDVLSG